MVAPGTQRLRAGLTSAAPSGLWRMLGYARAPSPSGLGVGRDIKFGTLGARGMSHTYAQNIVHVVFSTKDRRPSIAADFRSRLWSYIAGICKQEGIFAHEVGGMPDHVHLLIQVPPTLALAKVVATIKANSSRWAHERGHKFAWQPGYAAFSVSTSVVPTVARYIQNQASHHKKMSFHDEFLALLKKHGLQADSRDTSIDEAETSESRDE